MILIKNSKMPKNNLKEIIIRQKIENYKKF